VGSNEEKRFWGGRPSPLWPKGGEETKSGGGKREIDQRMGSHFTVGPLWLVKTIHSGAKVSEKDRADPWADAWKKENRPVDGKRHLWGGGEVRVKIFFA